MNNFSMSLKKMFSNKNFVTAICFLLIGVILIVGYNSKVNSAISPVKIPYAKVTISPQTKVTADMIEYVSVARDSINEEYVYTSAKDVVNKYTNLESTVYAGSYFYKSAVVEKDNLPTSALLNVPEGETLLRLAVNMNSSYYNSLVPGDYFDLYVRTIGILPGEKNKEDEIIVGKLIDNIKILAVRASNGKNVFGTDEVLTPAGVLFSLPEEQALLIRKAEYFAELSDVNYIEFIIVPRGTKYTSGTGETVTPSITSGQLEEYIKDKTKDIKVNSSTKTEE